MQLFRGWCTNFVLLVVKHFPRGIPDCKNMFATKVSKFLIKQRERDTCSQKKKSKKEIYCNSNHAYFSPWNPQNLHQCLLSCAVNTTYKSVVRGTARIEVQHSSFYRDCHFDNLTCRSQGIVKKPAKAEQRLKKGRVISARLQALISLLVADDDKMRPSFIWFKKRQVEDLNKAVNK